MANLFSKFFGRTISDAAGFALGGAMRSPLEPPLVELTNTTWEEFVKANIFVPLEASAAAEIAAEDVASVPWAKGQAAQRGTGGDQMDKLIGAVLNAPGVPELFTLRRRNLIDPTQLEHGYRKAKLEKEWDGPLSGLLEVLLTVADLANAVVQGHMDMGAATAEAGLQGISAERFVVLVENTGLPPGPATLQSAVNRGLMDQATFDEGIREGHTKTKYVDLLYQMREAVLHANDYVTNTIRGWSDAAAMHAGGALTGHTPEQMDLLFQNHGRPLSWHQIFIGLRRGGVYDGGTAGIDPAFLKGLRESDIRPEWYDLAWAQRHTYPAAFVLRGLVQSGDISQAEGEQILLYEGWEPTLAKTVSAKWAQGTTAAAKEATAADLLALWDGEKATTAETHTALVALGYPAAEAQAKMDVVEARRVTGAKQSAIGDLHTSYKKGALSNAKTHAALEALGITAAGAGEMVAAWEVFLTAEGGHPPA
jgi:hypothetical protein